MSNLLKVGKNYFKPYFRYDDPRVQGTVYDTTGLGSWWQTIWTGTGFEEVYMGRDKPSTAE